MSTQPIVPPPPTPPIFGPLWKLATAIAILSTAAVLLALWPFLRALGRALTDAVELYGNLIAITLFLFFVGLLVAGLRIAFAYGWKHSGQARQAHVVKLQNNMPVPLKILEALAIDEARFTLGRHYDVLEAEASRATPLLTSQNVTIHQEGLAPQQETITDVTPTEGQLPELPAIGKLSQLHQIGHICRSDRSLLVGYHDTKPQYIELADLGFLGIGGKGRSTKTTTALLLLEQAALSNWHIFIGDPHVDKDDGLINRCRPFSGRIERQAVAPSEIEQMIRTVDRIGHKRVHEGETDRTPILMVVDEFSNLVWRKLLSPDALAILPSMAAEYAGVGIHGILIAHDWSKNSLGGDLGAALRRMLTHRILHRMDPGNLEFLLPRSTAIQARQIMKLGNGQAIYQGLDSPLPITVPWLVGEDATYAAQGAPTRYYIPRALQLSAARVPPVPPLAPTQRVSTPAAPTAQLAPMTIPEQIVDLLISRGGYMTGTEIATQLGTDLAATRTELTELFTDQLIQRRRCQGRRTKETYEYTAQTQSVQPVQSTTQSAA